MILSLQSVPALFIINIDVAAMGKRRRGFDG